MKLAIVGYGALGQQLELYAKDQGPYGEVTLFDDIASENGITGSEPFRRYDVDEYQDHTFAVGIGYNHFAIRQQVYDTLLVKNRNLFTFISPHAVVHSSAKVSPGCTLLPGVILELNASLEHGVLLHEGTSIAHDSRIGACSYLSPGVRVSGSVQIGKRCFLGTGALVADGVSIGDDVIIGIGTVVTRSIPNSVSVIGNPFRILKRQIKLTR